jgi:spore maturation protein CgeB
MEPFKPDPRQGIAALQKVKNLDSGRVVLGASSLESLEKKDLYYEIGTEFSKQGYDVVVVGYRELFNSVGITNVYWNMLKHFKAIARVVEGSNQQDESGPAESPGSLRSNRVLNLQKILGLIRPDRFVVRRKLEKILFAAKPNLFLTQWYLPEAAVACKNLGVTTALWCMDDPMIFDKEWFQGKWLNYSSLFDYVFTSSKGAVRVYRDAGIKNVEWLPLYADTDVVKPVHIQKKLFDFTFVGTNFSDRAAAHRRILEPLIEKYGRRVHLFGARWQESKFSKFATIHPPVPRTELGKVFSQSKVCVNLHREVAHKYAPSFNFRTFEIPAARTAQLMEYILGLNELFELNAEVVAVSDREELMECAAWLLEDTQFREQISTNGYRRVISQHTVGHRVKKIINITA